MGETVRGQELEIQTGSSGSQQEMMQTTADRGVLVEERRCKVRLLISASLAFIPASNHRVHVECKLQPGALIDFRRGEAINRDVCVCVCWRVDEGQWWILSGGSWFNGTREKQPETRMQTGPSPSCRH